MKIQNKVFVVTGAGNGIGREVVLEILSRGGHVAALDMSAEGLKETLNLSGQNKKLSTHPIDVTNREAVGKLPTEIGMIHENIDGVINVAGIIQPFVRVNELSFDQIDKVMNVNFNGVVNVTKTLLPILLKRPEAHILNVSSMGSYAPVPGQTIYGASKAAVKLFTEGLHSELLGTNVGVTIFFPGSTATNIALNSGIMTKEEMAKMAPSDMKIKTTPATKVAELIIQSIEAKSYRAFGGNDAKTMDILSRIMPERAAKIIFDQMKSLLK
jgi:short-subunit dehydrogenase